MRKMFRTLVFGIVIAIPLLLAPHQSKAGGFLDGLGNLIHDLFGGNNQNGQGQNGQGQNGQGGNQWSNSGTPSTSVPLNEGTVFLVIAGLGLGVKMIHDRRKQVENSVI